MVSAVKITMDYRETMRRAEELEQLARRIKRKANGEYREAQRALAGVWSGEAAEAYLKKTNRIRDKLLRNAEELDRTADVLKRAATRLYRAEMLCTALPGI